MLDALRRAQARRRRQWERRAAPVLTLTLDPDQAAALSRRAALAGLPPNALAARLVADSLTRTLNEGEEHDRPRPHA